MDHVVRDSMAFSGMAWVLRIRNYCLVVSVATESRGKAIQPFAGAMTEANLIVALIVSAGLPHATLTKLTRCAAST